MGSVIASGNSELLPYPSPCTLVGVSVDNDVLSLSYISPEKTFVYQTPPDWPAKLAPGRLANIDHIVVLTQENRSFDHMLGYLSLPLEKGGMNRKDVDGLKGGEFNMFDGRKIGSFRLAAGDVIFSPGPPNDSERVAVQVNGGAMDGFVQAQADETQVRVASSTSVAQTWLVNTTAFEASRRAAGRRTARRARDVGATEWIAPVGQRLCAAREEAVHRRGPRERAAQRDHVLKRRDLCSDRFDVLREARMQEQESTAGLIHVVDRRVEGVAEVQRYPCPAGTPQPQHRQECVRDVRRQDAHGVADLQSMGVQRARDAPGVLCRRCVGVGALVGDDQGPCRIGGNTLVEVVDHAHGFPPAGNDHATSRRTREHPPEQANLGAELALLRSGQPAEGGAHGS